MTTPLWTAEELNTLFNSRIPSNMTATGISVDSRTTGAGDLFIALEGENHNGHRFVEAAIQAGATLAICHTPPVSSSATTRFISVPDTYQALYQLAEAARKKSSAKIVAVTGSFGKTTTKEMLAYCLKQQAETACSQKSYNNHRGVPISLASMHPSARFGVFEIGMNHAGEISPLTKLVRPHVALITDIGLVHKEYFKDLAEIVQAKCEIFEGMDKDGTVILNRDSLTYDQQRALAEKHGIHHFITFGRHSESDLLLSQIEIKDDVSHCEFLYKDQKYSFTLAYVGTHWVMDALAALACVIAVGADLDKSLKVIENFRPPLPGRGERIRIRLPEGGFFTIIDESYNSNPVALEKALNVLSQLGKSQQEKGIKTRLIAVIGDMYELGATSRYDHQSFAQICADLKIDHVFTCGKESEALFNNLPAAMKGEHSDAVTPVAEAVVNSVEPGDLILVKGSRGGGKNPRLQEVVDQLKRLAVKESV